MWMKNYERNNRLRAGLTISAGVGLVGLLGSIVAMTDAQIANQYISPREETRQEFRMNEGLYKTMADLFYGLAMVPGLGLMILNHSEEKKEKFRPYTV